jgi:hypothetical protein
MAINAAVTAGTQNFPGTIRSIQYMSHSTATAAQSVDVSSDVSCLGAGTATGDNRNNMYHLPAGVEGQVKFITLGTTTAATGEAAIDFSVGTATGCHVFGTSSDYVKVQYINDTWMVLDLLGATIATATNGG